MKLIKDTATTSFGLAGLGIGLGIVGEQFSQSSISSAGGVATGFISPIVNIGMAGTTIKILKNMKNER